MKRSIVLLLAAGAIGSAAAQPSVGVSIGINQPGFYGRINIGDLPRPALVYEQPVIIQAPAVQYERRPIYLYVPPTHQQDWRRYCGRYSACNQPVYFVQDQWVRDRYEHEHPGWDNGRNRGNNKRAHDNGRRNWDNERRDDNRGDDRGGNRGDNRGDDRGQRRH
jgi:hypothetical protein